MPCRKSNVSIRQAVPNSPRVLVVPIVGPPYRFLPLRQAKKLSFDNGTALRNASSAKNRRSEWGSSDEPCHGKLPFDLWTLMKAEGSAQSSDAHYVRENCIQTQDVGLVELVTPEVPCIISSTSGS